MLETLRRDPKARAAQEDLLAYLTDPASKDALGQVEALAELLSSSHDMLQDLETPRTSSFPSTRCWRRRSRRPPTSPTGPSVIDATTALLTRIAGHAVDGSGNEICAREVDPNNVVSVALAHLVTPMAIPGCTPSAQNPCLSESPLEVVIDTIADVNRAG